MDNAAAAQATQTTVAKHGYPHPQLSPHFALNEFTVSQTAGRAGLRVVDYVTEAVFYNLQALCFDVLEPVRAALGVPVTISSGFRPPVLNALVRGSAPASAHTWGGAADIVVPGMKPADVANTIAALPCMVHVDQLIIEYGQWVHIGLARMGRPRQQRLRAGYSRATGAPVYAPVYGVF